MDRCVALRNKHAAVLLPHQQQSKTPSSLCTVIAPTHYRRQLHGRIRLTRGQLLAACRAASCTANQIMVASKGVTTLERAASENLINYSGATAAYLDRSLLFRCWTRSAERRRDRAGDWWSVAIASLIANLHARLLLLAGGLVGGRSAALTSCSLAARCPLVGPEFLC